MKKFRIMCTIIILASIFSSMAGCASTDSTVDICYADTSKQNSVDYSQSQYWLSLPKTTDKTTDVFYVYPTCWKRANGDPQICEINNISMIKGATRQFQAQATVFEPVGNIFAPFYRQAAADILLLPLEQQQAIVSDIPANDVISAFDYYVKNLNNGRPYILAGHSQGSNILLYLLSEYMKQNPDVYKRMIVAYVIGYSVTIDYIAKNPHLKFATSPDDTGVIVSYNTVAPNVLVNNNPIILSGAKVINPITWTTDEILAPASQNAGSLVLNPDATVSLDNVPVMNYADAKIDISKNALICSSVNQQSLIAVSEMAAAGIYHSFDYAFYYFNLRKNAQNRVNKYQGK